MCIRDRPSPSQGTGGLALGVPAFPSALFPTMPSDWKNAVTSSGNFAGGGGAGIRSNIGSNVTGPSGGGGGGGDGSPDDDSSGSPSPTATGDGENGIFATGGGAGGPNGGNNRSRGSTGGPGIVIIRYSA